MGPRILVLPGTADLSLPDGRLAFEAARRLAVTDAAVVVLSLADYPLPLFDGGAVESEVPTAARQLAERIASQDALLLVSPEVNGSVPPLAKNAVDWAASVPRGAGDRPLRPFAGLVVGLASASPGHGRDFPALAAWKPVFHALEADVIEADARIPDFADTIASRQLDAFLAEFGAKARALGRRPS